MSYTKHDRIVSGAEIYASDIKDMDNKIYDLDSHVTDLQGSVNILEPTASASDVGKALKVKTVAGGRATEYEFGETAIIDSTLTEAGKAADAKKTGDEITDLKSALNNNVNFLFNHVLTEKTESIAYDQGGLSVNSASGVRTTKKIRTHSVLPQNILGFMCPSGKLAIIYAFENATYIGRLITDGTFSKSTATGISEMPLSYAIFDELLGAKESYTYKLVIMNSDDADIVPADASDMLYAYSTDTTLTISGKAADAETVGTALRTVETATGELQKKTSSELTIAASYLDFTENTVYDSSGNATTASGVKSTKKIDCTAFSRLRYKLRSGANLALITFFDTNDSVIYQVNTMLSTGAESSIPIPANAITFVASHVQNSLIPAYIYAVYRDSLPAVIDDAENNIIGITVGTVDFDTSFTDPRLYNSSGTIVSGGTGSNAVRMAELTDCSRFDAIAYGVISNPNGLPIVFFDQNLNFLSGIPNQGSNKYITGVATVPSGAKFVAGTWLLSVTQTPYLRGIRYQSLGYNFDEVKADLQISENQNPVMTIVTPDMTTAQFVDAYNNALTDFATLCKCDIHSFHILNKDWDMAENYYYINMNFRQNVYVEGMNQALLCDRINRAFAKPIMRFCDLKLPQGSCDYSKKFTIRSGEPSLYVSQDGSTLYVYGYNQRFKTTDGINWSAPEPIVKDNNYSIGHIGFSVVDDMIWLIGRKYTSPNELLLYTSPITDGLNFTYRGIPISLGHDFGDGLNIDNWGNSYVVKDGDKYYLFIEGRQNVDGNFWDIYLMTCTDPFLDNGDGTVGDWVNSDVAPVISINGMAHTSSAVACGNPDFAKGPDNRPIKVNGKWYMYFHSTLNAYSYIIRCESVDLVHWTNYAYIFDNRNRPTAGQNQSSNADHAIIEFKGRTYLFYTTDINTELEPHLAYMVDDRPIREILSLRP